MTLEDRRRRWRHRARKKNLIKKILLVATFPFRLVYVGLCGLVFLWVYILDSLSD